MECQKRRTDTILYYLSALGQCTCLTLSIRGFTPAAVNNYNMSELSVSIVVKIIRQQMITRNECAVSLLESGDIALYKSEQLAVSSI